MFHFVRNARLIPRTNVLGLAQLLNEIKCTDGIGQFAALGSLYQGIVSAAPSTHLTALRIV